MGILIEKAGIFTTVQDMGREGYQKMGFRVSGVMDRRAYTVTNLLAGNDGTEAVLEFVMQGPTIVFEEDEVIALGGGEFGAKLNGDLLPNDVACPVHKGDRLELGFVRKGNYGYLAVRGGLDVPKVMGSRSTDVKCRIGGYQGRKLQDGDRIGLFPVDRAGLTGGKQKRKTTGILAKHYKTPNEPAAPPVPEVWRERERNVTVRVVLGPQEDYFTREGIQTFATQEYTVTDQCDRMGFRLDGPEIEHSEKGADIISDGIAFGSIQVPSHGKPIIMMADRQTTGGYTKIATVISTDLPKLAQCRPGGRVRFRIISVEEAQLYYRLEQEEYKKLKDKLTLL